MAAQPRTKVVVIGGTARGVGKTSIAIGVMAALRRRGYKVQAFKVGPDFVDPLQHETATGRPSLNLDSYLLSKEANLAALHAACATADVAVIEGVTGLYDSRDGRSEAGSTAQMAKWLGAPVVLVVDCWELDRSAAAVIKGYQAFDPALRLEALVLNNVGDQEHAAWLTEALTAAGVRLKVLGGVPKDGRMLSNGHLVAPDALCQSQVSPEQVAHLEQSVEANVDLDALLAVAAPLPALGDPAAPPPRTPLAPRTRIGVARDAAFGFCFNQNLALLAEAGAELVPFSPLGGHFPAGVAGLYLGGGYPEHHAERLAANAPMRAAVKAFAAAGGVVYAECGGLIYLSQSIQPLGALPAPMVGVFPFRTHMTAARLKTGYVEVQMTHDCVLFPPGPPARGHILHYSEITQERVVGGFAAKALRGASLDEGGHRHEDWAPGYTARMQEAGAEAVPEGYSWRSVLASYVYLHFGSRPDLAPCLVARCAAVDADAVGAAAAAAAAAAGSGGSLANAMRRAHSAAPPSLDSLPGPAAPLPLTRVRTAALPATWSSPNLAAQLEACEAAAARQPRHSDNGDSDWRGNNASDWGENHSREWPEALLRPGPRSGRPSLDASVRSASADGLDGRAGAGPWAPGWGAPGPVPPAPRATPSPAASPQASPRYASPSHGAAPAKRGPAPQPMGPPLPRHQPPSAMYHSHSFTQLLPAPSAEYPIPAGPWDCDRMHFASTSGRDSAEARSWGEASAQHVGAGPRAGSRLPSEAIVSLAPAATELLFALGLGTRVVGISDACDFPPEATARPQVLRWRAAADGGGSEAVTGTVEGIEGGGVLVAEPGAGGPRPMALDGEWLAREAPGLVLAQGAVGPGDADAAFVTQGLARVGLLGGPRPATRCVTLAPRTLAEALEGVLAVGAAAGVAPEAARLLERLRARLRATAAAAALPARARRPRLLVLLSLSPLVAGGCWLPEMKELAGAADDWMLPGDAHLRIAWDQVRQYAPDILVLAPGAPSLPRALATVGDLAALPGWWVLPAVKASQVFIAEQALLARGGPRLVEGVELLARMAHPTHAPACAPNAAALKLALHPGQRCRPRMLATYFQPFQ